MASINLDDVIEKSRELVHKLENFDDDKNFICEDLKVSIHFSKPFDLVILRYWIELKWDLSDRSIVDIENYINERNRDNGWMSWHLDKGDKRNEPLVSCLISTYLSTPVTEEVHKGMLKIAVNHSKHHETYFNENFGDKTKG